MAPSVNGPRCPRDPLAAAASEERPTVTAWRVVRAGPVLRVAACSKLHTREVGCSALALALALAGDSDAQDLQAAVQEAASRRGVNEHLAERTLLASPWRTQRSSSQGPMNSSSQGPKAQVRLHHALLAAHAHCEWSCVPLFYAAVFLFV
jgi:hypothetical protein